MAARLPLLHKTPFVLDERPLQEATSPHAGALSISRAFRSLRLPELIGANLQLRRRQRGFSEAQFIESISLLQAIGGRVWEIVVPSTELSGLRERYLVSNTAHRSDGVHARIVADHSPGTAARQAEPSLEDAYLHALAIHRSQAPVKADTL